VLIEERPGVPGPDTDSFCSRCEFDEEFWRGPRPSLDSIRFSQLIQEVPEGQNLTFQVHDQPSDHLRKSSATKAPYSTDRDSGIIESDRILVSSIDKVF
jgi:hypothetical protein